MEKREIISLGVIVTSIVAVIGLTAYISSNIYESLTSNNTTYVLDGIVDDTIPVISEVDNKLIEPYDDTNVTIEISYYDTEGTTEEQQKSLIKYDRTYMPSTGILYGSDNEFNCLSVAEGEVVSIDTSEMFGNIITIKHTNNITSRYSSLSEVNISVGDTVNSGEIIGISGTNKVSATKNNMLLFELMINGEYVNPQKYYNMEIDKIDAN
jgi:stage II sporulation protein Q